MYENLTYEVILQRMLEQVAAQNSSLDIREGSIIYNALAPAAAELTNMYIGLDTILNETFADTASREYLVKRCAERGISPKAASCAVLKAEFNLDVPLGSRFSLDDLNYAVTEKMADGVFRLQCETAGVAGNEKLGSLIPIEYIDGLTRAELTEVLILGEDEEDTENLRSRYFDSLASQPFGGNLAGYKAAVNALDGVGGVKVYPTWNGGGTVKLVIIDAAFGVPNSALISNVQTAIDPTVNRGQGYGLAPLGHVVTVVGVASTAINLTANITYQSGWAWEEVAAYVYAAIDAYLLSLAKTWAAGNNLIVRVSQIETCLLNVTGIIDVANVTVNGAAQNLTLGADYIPVRGSFNG